MKFFIIIMFSLTAYSYDSCYEKFPIHQNTKDYFRNFPKPAVFMPWEGLCSPASKLDLDGTKPLKVLLLGDSTVEAMVPRQMAYGQDQLEDMVRKNFENTESFPGISVVNQGLSGESFITLLNRFDNFVRYQVEDADFIYIRYGINDLYHYGYNCNEISTNLPKDIDAVMGKIKAITNLRTPKPFISLESSIPYVFSNFSCNGKQVDLESIVYSIVKARAKAHRVFFVDTKKVIQDEIDKGNTNLTYHRLPIENVPEELRQYIPEVNVPVESSFYEQNSMDPQRCLYTINGDTPEYCVLDNSLDNLMSGVPGWNNDKHPNLNAYSIIANHLSNDLIGKYKNCVQEKSMEDVGDFNHDGCTNHIDFLHVLDYWQNMGTCGVIDVQSWLSMLNNFGTGKSCR